MSKKNPKVLVIGPGRFVKGGITSVIKTHKQNKIWTDWNCLWLETFNDRNILEKLVSITFAFVKYIFKVHSYDIIHIHFPGGNSIFRKYFYFKIAKSLNKKIIIHIHAPSVDSITKQLNPQKAKLLFEQSNHIIAIANYWENELNKHYKVKQISTVYNSVPLPEISSKNKKNIVLFAGTVCKRKGYHDLLNAIPLVLKEIPDCKFIFAGNGDLQEANQMAQSLNITNNIDFLGWINGRQKAEVFEKTKIFCLPSYGEGLPMSILEALSYRIPVISTPVGGVTEVVRENETGFIVNPGDSKAIASRIIELLGNDKLYKQISVNARQVLQDDLSMEKICSDLSLVYTKVLTDS